MAKAQGRRNDETAQTSSQRTGPEKWILLIVLAIVAAVVVALLVLAL